MMKASPELVNYLHTRTNFIYWELYEIFLAGGITLRYTDYDRDIQLPDGRYFSSKSAQPQRTKTKLSGSINVDEMSVTLLIDNNDTILGTPLLHAAQSGALDGAVMSVSQCYFEDDGSIVGTLGVFAGEIDVEQGGGVELKLKVRSSVYKLNAKLPLRLYYPHCPYTLYDEGCGLNRENYLVAGTITSSAIQSFGVSINNPAGWFDQGGIIFTSGKLVGVEAAVRSYILGQVTTLIALPELPKIGDAFLIYPGCNKQPDTCKNKFNNFNRNRATPYIPMPEAVI